MGVVQQHLNRFNNAKGLLKTFLNDNKVTTSNDETIEELAAKLSTISLDADTIDGWHLDVRDDGSEPPAGITNTISLVFTKGG